MSDSSLFCLWEVEASQTWYNKVVSPLNFQLWSLSSTDLPWDSQFPWAPQAFLNISCSLQTMSLVTSIMSIHLLVVVPVTSALVAHHGHVPCLGPVLCKATVKSTTTLWRRNSGPSRDRISLSLEMGFLDTWWQGKGSLKRTTSYCYYSFWEFPNPGFPGLLALSLLPCDLVRSPPITGHTAGLSTSQSPHQATPRAWGRRGPPIPPSHTHTRRHKQHTPNFLSHKMILLEDWRARIPFPT